MKFSLKQPLSLFRRKFMAALPVILFFLFLFYTTIAFFGAKYAIVVSFTTVLFKTKYQKTFSARAMGTLFFVQLGLCLLSFVATLSLPMCILLNSAVPFLLVYLQSTQFNPKGYFNNAMGFVFLQLRPVGWAGILPLLGVMVYALSILIIALFLYAWFHKPQQNYATARAGLKIVSEQFALLAGGKSAIRQQEDVLSIQQALHKLAYDSRGYSYMVTGAGKIHYMFALLFQRTSYFIDKFSVEPEAITEDGQELLTRLSDYTRRVVDLFNESDNTPLIEEAKRIQSTIGNRDDYFDSFLYHFLRLFILILETLTQVKATRPQRDWKMPMQIRPIEGMRYRLKLDSFEVRFAFQLACVTLAGFLFSRLTNINHAYWFPLNAFLMLQPMYEDSTYRVKTRMIGTSIGCILEFFLAPFFPGLVGKFIFATIMVGLMYSATPGTWIQPIFSTCFAVTMTSLTMNYNIAIQLRISYVFLALLLVWFVSRFLFPTSLRGQFEDNIADLFHIHNTYLHLLGRLMHAPIDYGMIREVLTHFHLVYQQIIKYTSDPKNDLNAAYYRQILSINWRMVSEIEQVLFYIQSGQVQLEDQRQLERFRRAMSHALSQMLRIAISEPSQPTDSDFSIDTEIADEPSLSTLLTQYKEHAEQLYQLILKHYGKKAIITPVKGA